MIDDVLFDRYFFISTTNDLISVFTNSTKIKYDGYKKIASFLWFCCYATVYLKKVFYDFSFDYFLNDVLESNSFFLNEQ